MYRVETKNSAFEIYQEESNERLVALRDGHTLLIAQTYHNLARIDTHRAQDFLHGVLLTMTHVVATGVMPVVAPE